MEIVVSFRPPSLDPRGINLQYTYWIGGWVDLKIRSGPYIVTNYFSSLGIEPHTLGCSVRSLVTIKSGLTFPRLSGIYSLELYTDYILYLVFVLHAQPYILLDFRTLPVFRMRTNCELPCCVIFSSLPRLHPSQVHITYLYSWLSVVK